MFSRSTLLHLRIPFSYFLLPIFLFSLVISPNLLQQRMLWILVILHIFLYPASNGFNSYYDKDEKSIGGLKNPPPVSIGLLWMSLLFDVIALVLGALKINLVFAVMLFVYGLASKAYSHPAIRLKQYPIAGWLVTGFFQGFFTFQMCYIGLNNYQPESALLPQAWIPASLASLMLFANYPMTQVYQHEEDMKHGDRTLSMMLGIRGTFLFAAGFFVLTTLGFVIYFLQFYQLRQALGFLTALAPVGLYFGYWFWRVWHDPTKADFRHAMWMNFVSATSLVIYFVWFLFDTHNIGQYLF